MQKNLTISPPYNHKGFSPLALMVSSVLASSAISLSASSASALSFKWSFVPDVGGPTGPNPYVVEGTIEGLQEGSNDGTGLTVTVTSTPTGQLTSGYWIFQSTNNGGDAFTVSSGAVTFADAFFYNGFEVLFFGGFGGYLPQLLNFGSGSSWETFTSATTFTPQAAQPVPEPVTILGSLVALGVGTAFKKHQSRK